MGADLTACRRQCQRPAVTGCRSNVPMSKMGDRIRAEREALGLSREFVAARAGIKPSTLSDIELGYSKTTRALPGIAGALGLSALWLETGKGEKMPIRSAADNSDIAEVRIALVLMAQHLAASMPNEAERLADKLSALPNGLADRPFVKALIDTIRAEAAQRALLPAPIPPAPAPDAHKRP